MLLAATSSMADQIMDRISDHPWPGCQIQIGGMTVTWMSSAIASMIITALVLVAVIIPMARKHKAMPSGSANVLDLVVVFVRDMIARPALHDKSYQYLPLLLTLFLFILGMNLMGIIPLEAISHLANIPAIGHTATSIPTVCAGLASIALFTIIVSGMASQVRRIRRRRGLPMSICILISPWLWVKSLSPEIPGPVGSILLIPLALMELIGAVAKCFSLMIRLCANMITGHALLAVMMVFILEAMRAYFVSDSTDLFLVGPAAVAGAVAVSMLELLVAGLQAYIFTFLTAMFVGLYAEGAH